MSSTLFFSFFYDMDNHEVFEKKKKQRETLIPWVRLLNPYKHILNKSDAVQIRRGGVQNHATPPTLPWLAL